MTYKPFSKHTRAITEKNIIGQGLVSIISFFIILGICILFLFPTIYCLLIALQSPDTVNDPGVILVPKSFSFESIKIVWEVLDIGHAYIYTGVSTIFSTLGTVISCSLAGYSLARYNYKEKPIIFGIVLLMIVIPPQTLQTAQFLNYSFFDFGGLFKIFAPITGKSTVSLIDTLWVYILPAFFAQGLKSGIFIFIFRQFFLGIPKNLEEAAGIDGCGAWGTLVRIVVPITVPAFITVILFSIVWHWTDYYNSMAYFTEQRVLLGQALNDIGTLLNRAGYLSDQYNYYDARTFVQAATLLVIAPLMIMYIFLQKYFTEGIERSGLVG